MAAELSDRVREITEARGIPESKVFGHTKPEFEHARLYAREPS